MNEEEQNGVGSSQGHGRSPFRNTTHSQIHNSPFSPAPLRFPSNNRHYVTQPATQEHDHVQEQTEHYSPYGQMQPPPRPESPLFVVTHPNAQGYVRNQQQTQGHPTYFHQWQTQPSAEENVQQTPTYQAGLRAPPLDPFQRPPRRVGVPEPLRPGKHTYVGPPLSAAELEILQAHNQQRLGNIIYRPQPSSPVLPQTPPQHQSQEPSTEQVPLQQQTTPPIHPQSDRQRRPRYHHERRGAHDESDSSPLQTHEQVSNAISDANVQRPVYNIAGYPENPGYEAGDDVTSDELDHDHNQVFTGFGRPSPAESPDTTPYRTTAGNPQSPSVNSFRPELYEREPATHLPWSNLGQNTSDQSSATRVRDRYHRQGCPTVQIRSQRQSLGQEFHTTSGTMESHSRSEAIQFPPQSEGFQLQRQSESQHHIQHHAEENHEDGASYNTSLEDAFRCNVGDENYPPSGEENSAYYRQRIISDHEEPGQSSRHANPGHSNLYHPPANLSNYAAGAAHRQYNHQRNLAQSEQDNPWAAYPMHPAASVLALVSTPTPAAITRAEPHSQTPAPASGPGATGMKMTQRVVFTSLSGGPALRDDPRTRAREKRKEAERAAAEEKKEEKKEKKKEKKEKKKEKGGGRLFGRFKKKEGSVASQPQLPAPDQTFPAERGLEAVPEPPAQPEMIAAPAAAIAPLVRSGAESPTAFGGWGPALEPPPAGPLPRTPICRHCQARHCPRCYYCHELGCELCWYCHQAECQHQPLATLHPPHCS